MKKVLSTLLLSTVTSISLFAFTWSGLIDNTTKASTADFSSFSLNQSNGIYLSMNAPLTNSLSLAAEGLYKYNYTNPDAFTNIVDMDLLKLSGKWNAGSGFVNLSAGRFSISDASGAVFSQTCDGVYFSYDSSSIKAALYGGYTGLLNSLNVSMTAAGSTSNNQFYNLAAAYVPLSADFSYSFGSGNGNIGLQALYFYAPAEELKSQFYSTLSIKGQLATAGTYSLSATVGSTEFEDLMMYSKLSCSFYMAQSGIVSLGGEYASGKQGPFNPFNTITARTACNYGGGIPTSGVLMPVVSAAFVSSKIYASINEKLVCLLPEDTINFEGFDTNLSLLYNLFSDVQLGLDFSIFSDINDSSKNYYTGTVKASLSF